MTPAAKEGLVAAIDRAQRVSRPLLSPDGGTSFEATVNFVNAFDAIRKSLSALTAEAGKGLRDFREELDANGKPTGYLSFKALPPDDVFSPWNACCYRETCREYARLALSTATPAGEWIYVPRKITEAMCDACHDVPSGIAGSPPHPQWIWDAMLAASPRGASNQESGHG
jgi:hypothetical protein